MADRKSRVRIHSRHRQLHGIGRRNPLHTFYRRASLQLCRQRKCMVRMCRHSHASYLRSIRRRDCPEPATTTVHGALKLSGLCRYRYSGRYAGQRHLAGCKLLIPMSQSEQMVFIGGRKAFGGLTNTAWGFDGYNLMPLSTISPIPALEGMVLFPHISFRDPPHCVGLPRNARHSSALGGKDAAALPTATYISPPNYGVTWRKGDSLLQLPSYMPTSVRAQAVVFPVRYPLSRSERRCGKKCLSKSYAFLRLSCRLGYRPKALRVSKTGTAVHLSFPEERKRGLCHDTVWRGVINRMTYKPIQ